MTIQQLNQLATLAELASQAPWHTWEYLGEFMILDAEKDGRIASCQNQRDQAFIAAANPQTIKTLIAAIRQLADYLASEMGEDKTDTLQQALEET